MNSSRGEEQCEIVKLHIQFQKYFHNDFMHCVANVYHEKKLGISFFLPKIFGPVALKHVKDCQGWKGFKEQIKHLKKSLIRGLVCM